MIWSARNSVGFSHTSTPFDRVSTVTPISGISRRAWTVPGRAGRVISSFDDASSRHAVTVAARPAVSASLSCVAVTGVRPAFCGADASTTRLVSGSASRAYAATSSLVIVCSSSRARGSSRSIPGTASWLR